MAELVINKDERPGILKEIDEGALDLVFQAIQEDIYSFPVPSFIRETISNGLDGVVEREIAKKILVDGIAQDEFYLQRTDNKLLKDSSFDTGYYVPKYLSDENRVFVDYRVDHPRDVITIKDYGVGLGGSRLQGYFKIGYSSKRNMKDVIGKFGSGSKAALATGVDYFIMHTTYNGFKTSFMIFKNDYEAITQNHPNGKNDVWSVKMTDGSTHAKTIYWEPVTESNNVVVELEVKKHQKNAYINAVKNQFQYFDGKVRLSYELEDGDKEIDHLNETPLYESDNLLIPMYSTYTVPHILVDGISYGPIDFPELEWEKMKGKIALKVRATEVDITQSRETLKYTDRTKKVIRAVVEKAREEATDYVTQLLNVDDPKNLFKLNNIYGRLSKDGSTAVASVFSKFLSMHNLKPKFEFELLDRTWDVDTSTMKEVPVNVPARLDDGLFDFLFYKYHIRELSVYSDGGALKLSSDKVSNFSTIRFSKIVFASESTLGPKLANHILGKYNVESFIYIRSRPDRAKTTLPDPLHGFKDYRVSSINQYVDSLLKNYGDLNLDTYDVKYDEKVDVGDLDDATVSTYMTPAQERRLNQEVLYTYFETELNEYYSNNEFQEVNRHRKRESIKISSLDSHFRGEHLLIVTGSYDKLGQFIELSQIIFPGSLDDVKVIYIAKDKVKHFLPYGTLIADYFRTVNQKTGELMIGEHIRNLNTLRQLQIIMDKYEVFSKKYNIISSLTTVDTERIHDIYKSSKETDLKTILTTSRGYDMDDKLVGDIFEYLDVLKDFHDIVKTGNKELIASKALQCFNSEDIFTIDAYDEEFINDIDTQFERLVVIEPLLELISDYSNIEDATPLLELLINVKQKEQDELKL